MNDMEEEIDRIEKISYMKINNHYNYNHYNSQIAYTIKQGYTCTVEPLFYDHPQNHIGVVVKAGWSFMRGLT